MRDRVNQRRDNLLLWVGRQGGEIDTAPITASGYTVREVACSRKAQAALARDRFTVILLDLSASHAVGLQSLRRFTEHDYPLDVIAVNGDPCIEKAVQTVKAGAWDYLPKPISLDYLAVTRNIAVHGCRFSYFQN